MKAQASLTDILLIVFMTALLVAFLVFVFPEVIKDIFKMISLASADVVSRDLAGLITVSGAAPENITIYYEGPSEDFSYNVRVGGRIINVEMLDKDKESIGDASSRSGVDPVTFIKDEREFTIKKIVKDGQNKYDIYAGIIAEVPSVIPTGILINPLPGVSCESSWLTSRSGGRTHKGVDIFADCGTEVIAACGGIIVIDKNDLGGNALWIIHDESCGKWSNYRTYYAHLQNILVDEGQKISQGDVIGTVGNTGQWDGEGEMPCHLHFSLVEKGKSYEDGIDPAFVCESIIRPVTGRSKLGFQTEFRKHGVMEFITKAKPAVVKLMCCWDRASEIKSKSPDTFIVGRIYSEHEPMNGDAEIKAEEWFNKNRGTIEGNSGFDCWEGYNEPVFNDRNSMEWYSKFEIKRMGLLEGIGKKACIGSFSTGNPADIELWSYFMDALNYATSNGHYLSLHEYSCPRMDSFFEFTTGRYREVYNQYGLTLPLIITETGIDSLPGQGCESPGWRTVTNAEDYFSQLVWYDSILRQDDYVIGAAIFHFGFHGWDNYEIHPELTGEDGLLVSYMVGELQVA